MLYSLFVLLATSAKLLPVSKPLPDIFAQAINTFEALLGPIFSVPLALNFYALYIQLKAHCIGLRKRCLY